MNKVKTHSYHCTEPWCLESGDELTGLTLQYQTLGKLNAKKDNVIWVCHAFSGTADFCDWWPGLFGAGCLFDPEQFFIVCANMPGSCYGSTGPLTQQPGSNEPYYHNFPAITNRDIASAFDLLRRHLGLTGIHTLIGPSLGGQQALEWALMRPAVFRHLILVATNAQHSPWGIAFNETQRMAISQDPTWNTNHPDAGRQGMVTARAVAMLSYRHYDRYSVTQCDDSNEQTDGYRAASYQRYQGFKLSQRFNAFSYWVLSKAMDSHNVGRNRESIEAVLGSINVPTLLLGVSSDQLFPLQEQQLLQQHIAGARLQVIQSDYGHDGFLVETKQVATHMANFYAGLQNNIPTDKTTLQMAMSTAY